MATDPLQLQLTTLTPIWTGGADGKSDRLHVTGIMGSLRWWYEVFVRSVGGTACDPTDHTCIYDKTNDGLCDVCRVFGATGWARRFKIIISEDGLHQKRPSAGSTGDLVFNVQGSKWYLPGEPLYGQAQLTVIPTTPLDKDGNYFDPNIVGSLLQFIADRASLGAKPQMGMGIVRLTNRQSLSPLVKHLEQIDAGHKPKTGVDEKLPCLQNMFFARIHVASATESDTFGLKYDLRGMFRELKQDDPRYTDDLRHTIMGYVGRSNREPERIGAKIMMSYPYGNGTIRMWGWIPAMNQLALLGDILGDIYDLLKKNYGEDNILSWLDYASQADSSVMNYLKQYFLEGAV